MRNEERKLWMVLAASLALVAIGLGGLFVYTNRHPAQRVLQSSQTLALARAVAESGNEIRPEPPEAVFSSAMDRFGDAVREHPGMSGDEVVNKVNARAPNGSQKPCPFEWHNGEAALQIQRDQFGKPSLTATINDCTEAIKQLPR